MSWRKVHCSPIYLMRSRPISTAMRNQMRGEELEERVKHAERCWVKAIQEYEEKRIAGVDLVDIAKVLDVKQLDIFIWKGLLRHDLTPFHD